MSKSSVVYPSSENMIQGKIASCRYWCMRLVSCPVPGIKASVPIIGGRTLVEIICVAILILMAVSLALPSNQGAGHYGDFFGAATTVLGLRNNILQILFGISYERALYWHKVMGGCTLGMICFHALCGFNFSGVMMCFAMGMMTLTYLIKNMDFAHAFEVFYYTHLVSILLIIAFGQMHHSAMWFSLSGALWVLDVILRSFITSKTLTATATALPGEVIQLTFEGSIKYRPGQYAFIRIPSVNKVEFHPFTFSSCPEQGVMTMHVRELGDWTRRLGDLVRAHDKSGAEGALSMEVMLDGPYGDMQVDVLNPQYEVFLFISGGIGITPNQSLYNSLTSQVEAGRKLSKVYFLWSVKDKAIVDTMTPSLLSSSKVMGPELTPVSFQPPMVGRGPDNLNATQSSGVTHDSNNEGIELGTSTAASSKNDPPSDVESSVALPPSSMVFENRFYLTQVRDEGKFKDANINPKMQPWLHFGRPDIAATFDEVRALLATDQSGRKTPRVCVSVCGPPAMVHDVQEQCRISKLGCSKVAFDCHAEVFDL